MNTFLNHFCWYHMGIYSLKIPTDPSNIPQVPQKNTFERLSFMHRKYMQCTVVSCYYFAIYWFQTPWSKPHCFRRWWRRPPLAALRSSVQVGNLLAWCPGSPGSLWKSLWKPMRSGNPAYTDVFRGHARSLHCWPLEVWKKPMVTIFLLTRFGSFDLDLNSLLHAPAAGEFIQNPANRCLFSSFLSQLSPRASTWICQWEF